MCSREDDPSMHEEYRTPAKMADSLVKAAEQGPRSLIKAVLELPEEHPDTSQKANQIADMLDYFDYAIVPRSPLLSAKELADRHDSMIASLTRELS
jgi:hypothetical protein